MYFLRAYQLQNEIPPPPPTNSHRRVLELRRALNCLKSCFLVVTTVDMLRNFKEAGPNRANAINLQDQKTRQFL